MKTVTKEHLDRQFLEANERCKRMKNNGDCITCKRFVVWGAGTTGVDGRQHFTCGGFNGLAYLKQQAAAEARYQALTSTQGGLL